jgi:1-acyl-sn-glycerol-3-phosphate acyltransferase
MSSTISTTVQEYVAQQPKLAWRRTIMRWAIRNIGFWLAGKVEVTGTENIPTDGPTIIMMNHVSLIDPVLCMGAITPRFVVPMSKVENLRNPLLAPMIWWWGSYYINRGEVDRKALTNSIEMIKSGQMILIAPEGHRHPEGLSRPKDGLAYIATKADAVIVPTAVSGGVNWTKRLFRGRINVNFGRAFGFKTGGRQRIPRDELGMMMEEAMYQLAIALRDTTMRGVYSDLSKATTDYLEFLKP